MSEGDPFRDTDAGHSRPIVQLPFMLTSGLGAHQTSADPSSAVTHLKIDYVELASREIGARQGFLARAFGWTFVEDGPGYQAFANAGIDGGNFQAEGEPLAHPLVILKTEDLEAALTTVTSAGAEIVNPIFAFPGGRRFHFREPGGNEMAVWSER